MAGTYRSGRKPKPDAQRLVESCLSLSRQDISPPTDCDSITVKFWGQSIKIKLNWEDNIFGGRRFYLCCPQCDRRVWKLFMPMPKLPDRRALDAWLATNKTPLLCRHCWGLVHKSTRESDINRLQSKIFKVRLSLKASPQSDPLQLPDRPRYQHRKKYDKFSEELLELQKEYQLALVGKLNKMLGNFLKIDLLEIEFETAQNAD